MPRGHRPISCRLALATAIAAALIGLAAPADGASTAEPGGSLALARKLSTEPITVNEDWRGYDEAPKTPDVPPVRVVGVSGDVTNAGALIHRGTGTATLTYKAGGPAPEIVLDYGEEVGGVARFGVASSTGTELRAAYSEQRVNLTPTGDTGQATEVRYDTWPVTPATTSLSGREVQGAERYELVTLDSPGRIALSSASIHFTAFRGTPDALTGHFLSSDQTLNRIWYAGAYTLNLNQLAQDKTAHLDLIMDGAKRDRLVWDGDLMISGLTDYATADPSYVRGSLVLLGEHLQSPGFPPGSSAQPADQPAGACSPDGSTCIFWSATYSMAFVDNLYEYYLHTGDLAFVKSEWQIVLNQMEYDQRQIDQNGLYSVADGNELSWNGDSLTGEVTYVNALYVTTLKAAAGLSDALGNEYDAAGYQRRAQSVSTAVNTRLWDAPLGAYDPSATVRGVVAQDANSQAILAGIASGARAREVIATLSARLDTPYGPTNVSSPAPAQYLQDVSPYSSGFQVYSEFESGQTTAALDLMRKEWGQMIDQDPGGVDWERIYLTATGNESPTTSRAHGWSTGPTPALTDYVAGITPRTAGYATWSVAPQPGNLQWAQAEVGTPYGEIFAGWRRTVSEGENSLVLTVQAPRRTSGTVAIPLLGAHRAIAEDGRLIWNGRQAVGGAPARVVGGDLEVSHVTGSHTFAWIGSAD